MRDTGFTDGFGNNLKERDIVEMDGDLLIIEMETAQDHDGKRFLDREVETGRWVAADHTDDGINFGGMILGATQTPLCNRAFRKRMKKIGAADELPHLYEKTQPLRNLSLSL